MFKRILVLLFTINLVLIVIAFSQDHRGGFIVRFFDVGQGDAIYIRTEQKQDILIDGGPNDAVLSKLGQAMPFYDRDIDILVISNPHADHVTGALAVLKQYRVKTVYFSGAEHTTYQYLELLRFLEEQKEIVKVKVDHPMNLELSEDTALSFLYPDFDVNSSLSRPFIKNNLNNTSVVVKLTHNGKTVLLTGDIGKEVEEYMLLQGVDVSANVLKIAHQGSRFSSGEPFLRAVHPQFAVIFVGQNNYGHPHIETLDRLRSLGIKFLRTDEEGDIEFSLK